MIILITDLDTVKSDYHQTVIKTFFIKIKMIKKKYRLADEVRIVHLATQRVGVIYQKVKFKMDEKQQKKLASAIVLKAREECRKKKIDPYIAVGAFIDETIRELSTINSNEKVAEFLVSIAEK